MFKQYNKIRDEREAATGMRQSRGAMIAKICAGILFIATGLCFIPDEDLSIVLFSCVIGLGFFAWGFVPYLIAADKKKNGGRVNTVFAVIESMQQSFGGMVAKITVGLLFIVTMLDDIKTETDTFIFTSVIGLGFIAWGLFPFISAWNNKKKQGIEELLSMPLNKYGEDEAEKLAEKYDIK